MGCCELRGVNLCMIEASWYLFDVIGGTFDGPVCIIGVLLTSFW
jgi:hypothetical protein